MKSVGRGRVEPDGQTPILSGMVGSWAIDAVVAGDVAPKGAGHLAKIENHRSPSQRMRSAA